MNEQQVEQEIQDKGLTAPRLTPELIDATIKSEHYFTAAQGCIGNFEEKIPHELDYLTFCVLVLKNGYTVTGESACASPQNFNAELGQKIAKQNAREKIWALEGYVLKNFLHDI